LSFSNVFSQDTLFYNSSIYNLYSIEINAGLNRPLGNFTPGYESSFTNLTFDGSIRYMLNENVGFKFMGEYYSFENSSSSLPFKTSFVQAGVSAVIHIHNLFDLNQIHPRVGFFVDLGYTLGYLHHNGQKDNLGSLVYSFEGKYRFSKYLALNLGFRTTTSFAQHHTFDGGPNNQSSGGNIVKFYTGLTYYFGKKKIHIDWHQKRDPEMSDLGFLHQRLVTLANENKEYKYKIDSLIASMYDMKYEIDSLEVEKIQTPIYKNIVSGMFKQEYFNVYFDKNSYKVQTSSLRSLSFLKNYMLAHPEVMIEVIAHTDESGDEQYNLELSQKRATEVVEIMTKLGIDKSRFRASGLGEIETGGDPQKIQLARKAIFKVIRNVD
jgi:OOP family OmpA-OmpF porin